MVCVGKILKLEKGVEMNTKVLLLFLLISLIFLVGCASKSELESALTEISDLEAQISHKDLYIEGFG